MTFKKNVLLAISLGLIFTTLSFGQSTKNQVKEEKSNELEYNSWAIGAGINNLIVHSDLRSIGTGRLGSFWNFGTYIYVDKMFNPVLGLEFKIDYSKIGGASQYFSDEYTIKYLTDARFSNEDLILDGYKYGAELNGIIDLTNLWKLNSRKWNLAFMAGAGYHRYTSKIIIASTGEIPQGTNFETNLERNNQDHASSMYLNTSLSLKYRINKRFDIELRPTLNLNNEDHFDAAITDKQIYETFYTTNLGLVYKFGKKDKYAIWINEEEIEDNAHFKVIDTDKDGVMDELDVEPETPMEAEVYGDGKAVDTDKDGIPDHIDKCILVPGPESNEGCPEDKDGDGIFDYDDVCPEVKGVKENLGCPKQETPDDLSERIFLLSKSIYFKTDSDEILGESFSILNEIAAIMLQYPNTQFQIDGHTDDRAPAYYNMNLSKRRASSVLSYLTNMGVYSSRLYSEGYGEEKPTNSNETESGRRFNRRVEINFIQPDSEKGTEIYSPDVIVTKSMNIVQPQGSGNLKDSDGDGVADMFDKELETPMGALVYGNGVAVDTDKDGIPDYKDECPLKYGSSDKNGCPLFNETAQTNSASGNISVTDSDGDGVIDILDLEADTPYLSKVYGNGVAIDTDNDGVIDLFDECHLIPGKQDNNGCPTGPTNTGSSVSGTTTSSFVIIDTDGDGVLDELDIDNNTPRGAKVYGNGVAIDTDNDGVIDLNDNCPLKPGIGKADGCPETPVITSNGQISIEDADNDGVIDSLDQEANTPAFAKVYGNGVSVDTDSDGIPDHSDKCPLKYGSSEKEGCPINIDADGDGVINEFDKEPNTPFGVKVYGNGVSMDTDSDGTPDHKDACPLKPGSEAKGGCPDVIENDNTGNVSLVDSDGDGVVDQFDKEANTPSGAKVYGNGISLDTDYDGTPDHSDQCPIKPGTVENNGCPLNDSEPTQIQLIDSDNDGVIDQFDKDPNTPAGALVYGNGIPIDSDRDGLPDYKDECPLKAGPVEKNGCPDAPTEMDWNDSDGDGVVNQFDKEPNTPKNARVYGNGVAVDSDYDDIPDHQDECPFKAGPVENKGCPKIEGAIKANINDSDKDGVIDLYDKEPNTPFGVKVYSNGVSIDSDKDKVPDYKDRCPLIKGLIANEGCPKDQDLDGDGVVDSKDLCPDVKGSAENQGCPDKNFDKSVSIKIEDLASKITFERTKNTLSNSTTETLDEIVKIMQGYPATKYQIAAHTDNKYNEKYSLFLSKRRANAIMKYLIDSGVNENRLTSEGYGDGNPKYPNDGDAATANLNNRIEFNFILPN
jgi:outer membrane protein OmpA-like peptidoglycan-associated protein